MTSVTELLAEAGVVLSGTVRWGEPVPEPRPGVYLISTSPNPREDVGLQTCPLQLHAVRALLTARPEATVDAASATIETLARRLRAMWPTGQPVVYIGLAGRSVAHRVRQFAATRIGARAPHAGGWPVKMLDTSSLWVHFGATDSSDEAEATMIAHFTAHIPPETRSTLIDPDTPIPFANLVVPRGRRKRHGLAGIKAERTRAERPTTMSIAREQSEWFIDMGAEEGEKTVVMTQPVTANDIKIGQVRLPRRAKSAFPPDGATIDISIGGLRVSAKWDPRTSGDKERSGVIRVGTELAVAHLEQGPPRRITVRSGVFEIH